jgi:hypothetical protein
MRKVALPDLHLVVRNFLDCSHHDDDHADAATYGAGGGTDTIFALQKGRYWPILLQKSKVAGRRIFREITKREAIADSYSVTDISEVACEFNVRR